MPPPAVRAPNGVVQDGAEFFGAGKPYYDPAKITVPTLLVGAEWDRDTPPYMAQTLFPLLVPRENATWRWPRERTPSSWSAIG